MLNNFGGAYTMKSLDEENYLDLIYMQICVNVSNEYQENQSKKANFYTREGF